MSRGVVGREHELAAIERVLAADDPGLRALVLEGDPGIGKTTLWSAAVATAADAGAPVLLCRPVEAEAKLGYASLADLVAPIVEAGLPELPEPQRVALEVALLRAVPAGPPPDRRAVATGVHSLLSRSMGPVVVAIDDVQWLDRASAAVLSFALRRLGASRLRVLVTTRIVGGVAPDPLDLGRIVGGRVARLRLAALSLSGVHHVIKNELDHVFPRPVLQRIAEASGGNPLFALELARALIEAGARPGPGEPLPVPDTLAALMATRVARLSAGARDALLACASLSSPDTGLVAAALGRKAVAALEECERAAIIVLEDRGVRFSHPLFASTVYSAAPAARRRTMHTALAAVVSDHEEQARHLALGVEGPDETVAARLTSAAREANLRGAPQAAVELAELSYRLTPADRQETSARRAFALAEYVFRAGDTAEAQRLLTRLVDDQAPGPTRARALELLARVLHVSGTSAEAVACCEQALGDAEGDGHLLARIHATAARVSWDDFDRARRHARAALELLETQDDPDPAVLSQALCAEIGIRIGTGGGLDRGLVEQALELERLAPMPDVSDRVSAAMGTWLKQAGDFDGARRWLEATHRAAIDEGDDASLPFALSHLPQLELWTGHWADAESRAVEHLQLAEETAQSDQRRQALYNLGLVHAHMGRVDEARAEAEELLHETESEEDPWSAALALSVLGLLDLSLGNAAEAAAQLARNIEIRDGIGTAEPLRAHGDYAQALIELGELDAAASVVDVFEERARASDRPPFPALAATARGLLAAAQQDLDAAAAALDEALTQHDRVDVPFDLARTLLAVGQVQRRRGERKLAKETLERARSIFDDLGAPLWSERAQAELRRIPIRRRASGALTATEEQVAELAAAGRTNSEIAARLFISRRTVEANLARVYTKLEIRSRAELGAKMAERHIAAGRS